MELEFIRKLVKPAKGRILLLVIDGLGGVPKKGYTLTELEEARTPNLDDLAAKSVCGLHQPVGYGITPGSGPAHLGLFGYNPTVYQVGRGVLAALGIHFDLQPGDIAARGNFCTIDDRGRITDRRAGRISTEKNKELCALLRQARMGDTDFFIEPVKEYRFLLVLRDPKAASADVADTDPQTTETEPLKARPLSPKAGRTAESVDRFAQEARRLLSGQHPANMVLLRGFSRRPEWPTVSEAFGIHAAAIAAYPMYRGLARLVGMEALETGETLPEEISVLENRWRDFDFFYLHVKKVDSAGEDGDFERKIALIEEVDELIPRIIDLQPDVMVVTGDHSTPSMMRSHSWHPVPVLLWSRDCRPDQVIRFGERACIEGSLGPRIPAQALMPLMLANAGRLEKFGA